MGESGQSDRTCERCGHRPHLSGECKARYHVTFEKGEPGDPCLCEVGSGQSDRIPPDFDESEPLDANAGSQWERAANALASLHEGTARIGARSIDDIMLNAIRYRQTLHGVTEAMRKADIEWLLSRAAAPPEPPALDVERLAQAWHATQRCVHGKGSGEPLQTPGYLAPDREVAADIIAEYGGAAPDRLPSVERHDAQTVGLIAACHEKNIYSRLDLLVALAASLHEEPEGTTRPVESE